jgi:lysozyme family protein
MISNPTAPNPNKLMAQLRMMPDQQLVQYAQMHKNDPYIFPMAFQESNTRKQMRAAQNTQAPPAPKVVDQNLQEMAQPMPEDQGIAMLPAPNMQNMAGGGIVAFDDGGEVTGYKTGGTLEDEVFERAFKKVLKFEGGSKYLKDDAGKGPTKYGINQTANPDVDIKNLTEDQAKEIYRTRYWNAIGGDALAAKNPQLATIAFDAAVNQGPGTAKKMLAQAGDNPYELLKLRQQLYVDLKNQNPEKFGKFLGGWTDRVSSLQKDLEQDRSRQGLPALTPGAQAVAATAPVTASTNPAVSQIPGQSVQAPAAKDESTFFGNLADRLGLSQETQRNISNTLMAPTPLAPVAALPKAAKSSGLAALGEKIYEKFVPAAGMTEKQIAALRAETEAAKLAQTAQLPPRLTPPAQVLEQGSQVIPVTQAGEATVQSAANLEKARLANQAADQLAASQAAARTAQETAKLPSMAERLQQASYLRESDEAARLMNRARAATDTKTAVQTGEGLAAITPTETEPEFETPQGGVSDLNSAFRQFEIGQQNKTEGVQVAKPEAEGLSVKDLPKDPITGGMDMNRLMMQMGLHLMAGKSPNLLTNVGEAGLGTLAMQQAEEKAKSEREAKMSEAEYRKAMGKYYGAYGEAIERGAKDKNNVALAEKAAQDAVDTWAKNNKMALLQSPDLYEQMRKKYRMEAYQSFGITPTMTAGAPTGGAKFLGFENPA